MTPAEARALIAEGQRVLTAEEHDGPTVWHVDRGSRRMSLRDEDGDAAGEFDDVWFEDFRSAALASWMRTNLSRLLDGYTEALEENERLQSELTEVTDHGDVWRERAQQMASRAGALETALREACDLIEELVDMDEHEVPLHRLRAIADAVESRTT